LRGLAGLFRPRSQRFSSALPRAGDLFGGRHFRRQAGLAAAQRLGHERVGQDEPGLGDRAHRNGDVALFLALGVVARQQRVLSGDATQDTPETLAAGDRLARIDLGEMAGPALEIARAHQRPVDARRRDLEVIGRLDGVVDVERRRHRLADLLATLDIHRAVRPFGHDLQGAAVLGADAHTHQPIAEIDDRRLDDRGNTRRHAALDDEARFLIGCRHRLVGGFTHGPDRSVCLRRVAANKKERAGGPALDHRR